MNLDDIYEKLEIHNKDSLIKFSDEKWREKVNFPSRVKKLFENTGKWSPDAVFCFDNRPLVLFFEITKKCDKKELHKIIWNFNESPVVIMVENSNVTIYNGFAIDKKGYLEQFGNEKDLKNFNYFELVTGKTFEKYNDELNYQHRVDYKLLKNIEAMQNKLCNEHNCTRNIANALIGKIIFIRYLIDRKVELAFNQQLEEKSKQWTNEEFCNLLDDRDKIFSFFEYLQDSKKGFNGDLFPISKNDFDDIPNNVFRVLKFFLEENDVKTGQKYLPLNLYDFSVLPIEFISNVYERFIGKENQKKMGAYYTPTFLVDYIINQTIAKKLNYKNNASCKVLDPACGSGIFLVETLRKIIENEIKINGKPEDKEIFKQNIKKLAEENIFGIDKDKSAIQVAIFSIYLTLLDYQDPADIKNFKFPKLLNKNFFEADFFDTEAKYNDVLKNKNFDFIIGNPPWGGGKIEKNEHGIRKVFPFETYIKKESKKDKECFIGNKEIAQAFLIRTKDFSSEHTKCALIIVSKVLYNLQSIKFRKYFLKYFFINRVFELAPVRHEIFNKSNDAAVAPACVLFFSAAKGKNTDKNIIEHISLKPSRFFTLFKIFMLTRNDFNQIQQNKLKEYDWLWKTLVYGSYLDFNFIKKLKNKFLSIQATIDNSNFIVKQGIKEKDGSKQIDVSEICGKKYIKTKDVSAFFIKPSSDIWTEKYVGYTHKDKSLYKAPIILMTEGISENMKSVSAISYQDAVFKSSLTGIKSPSIKVLRNILGILNSSLFSYINLMTFSSSGIEREQTHDKEKLSVPFCNVNIDGLVEKVEKLYIEYYSQTLNDPLLKQQISDLLLKIDKTIYEGFKCTEKEKLLIDYANNVLIPLQFKHQNYTKLLEAMQKNDKILKDYANLYIDRFASSFNQNGKKFIVEIYCERQIIGMLFKIVDKTQYKEDIVPKRIKNISYIVNLIMKIGTQKITKNLFIHKDVRGFEREYFYIFKPNERRLWHKAIGYLDVNEFADAILSMGNNPNE